MREQTTDRTQSTDRNLVKWEDKVHWEKSSEMKEQIPTKSTIRSIQGKWMKGSPLMINWQK